jgi:predicted dehydrogenase
MTNLGIHHVDTYQYLLGPIARVMALSRRVVLEIDVEDVTAIIFEFASGVVGYLGTSWLHANRTATIAVHGTDAQVWTDAESSHLIVSRRGRPERETLPLAPTEPVVEELAEFARCVREGARPDVGGEQGTANIAVLEAIVESARTGRIADVAA